MTKKESVKELLTQMYESLGSWRKVASRVGWNSGYCHMVATGKILPSQKMMYQLEVNLGKRQRRKKVVTPSGIPAEWNEIRKELGVSHLDIYRKGLESYGRTAE